MPPQAKAPAPMKKTQAPKTVAVSFVIPIDDVCTVDDGLWGPLNSDRVRELEEPSLTGQYDMNILKTLLFGTPTVQPCLGLMAVDASWMGSMCSRH